MIFTIRTATKADINDIMNIEENGFIAAIREEKSVFEKRIEVCPRSFLVFETDSKQVIGYICGEFMEKVPESAQDLALGHSPKDQNPDAPYFYISSFSILPAYRGNGTGKYLWNESLEFYKKGFSSEKKFLLLVNQEWQGAKHIYQKAGFKEVQTFKDFFPTENQDKFTDGVLMIK